MNTLVHKCEIEDRVEVWTPREMIDAIQRFWDDSELSNKHVVEHIAETLSDGSVVYNIRVRPL